MEDILGFLGRLCGLASVGSLFTTVEEGVGVLLVLLFSKDCVVASVRAEELVEGIGRDGLKCVTRLADLNFISCFQGQSKRAVSLTFL